MPNPKRRRARGTGSIFRDKRSGSWVGRVIVGRKPTGQPLYRELRARTQHELIRRMDAAGPPGPDVTVSAWAARWLASLSGLAPGTVRGYRTTVETHLGPAIGHLRLRDVTPSRVDAFVAGLLKSVKASTAALALAHVRIVFQAAVRDGLLDKNPATLARTPKQQKAKIDPFTPEELSRIIEAAPSLAAGAPLALMAATGCRSGEAFALDAGDWNPGAGTVSITKTYSKRFGLGPPKSKHSARVIRVPAAAVPVLVEAAGGRAEGPLFRSGRGDRLFLQQTSRAWGSLLRRLDMRYRNPHQLRHTCATLLVSAGVPLGDAAKYLGDSVQTIVKTYLHPAGTDPAATLDGLFGPR